MSQHTRYFTYYHVYYIPPPSGMSTSRGAGVPVCLASCGTSNAGHVGDAEHTFVESIDVQEHPILQVSKSRTSREGLAKSVQLIKVCTSVLGLLQQITTHWVA